MGKVISVLATIVFAAGCAPKLTNDCEDANGVDAHLRYGDSSIQITHKIKVKQEEAIILKLHPQQNPPSGTNYDDLEIKLIGEKFKDKWLNKTLKASDGSSKKIICVMMQKEGEYKYIVKVPGVGEIDPRVEVIKL